MEYYKHPQAIVESEKIGKNTRIWAFAHVLPGAVIGEDCNICDHTYVENDVVVGNRVTIKSGVQLWDGIRIEDDAFIGPNATFTNDPYPRSKQYPKEFAKTVVCNWASIGANATILPGVVVGSRAMVGAGAVVTRDVPPNAIVVGNPARIKGYDNTRAVEEQEILQPHPSTSIEICVQGVKILEMPVSKDLRGSLSVLEFADTLPFVPKRFFMIFKVPSKYVRGEHAHKTLHQFLMCIQGSLSLVLDDGINSEELRMNRPDLGVYIPPMVWSVQYNYSPDAVLAVLASESYRAEDYIRDYYEFLDLVKKNG